MRARSAARLMSAVAFVAATMGLSSTLIAQERATSETPEVAIVSMMNSPEREGLEQAAIIRFVATNSSGDEREKITPQPDELIRAVLQADSTPNDSLYLAARLAMTQGHFRQAATWFETLAHRYKGTAYAPRAMYFQSFSLYRLNETETLRQSLKALNQLLARYPKWNSVDDARILQTRVCGELARRGDRSCAAEVYKRALGGKEPRTEECREDDPTIELQITAINALYRVDTSEVVPILKKVMARRTQCALRLRRQAVQFIGQRGTPAFTSIAIDVLRNDPDDTIRDQMGYYLAKNLRTLRGGTPELARLYDQVQHRMVREGLISLFIERNDDASINKLIAIAKDESDPLRPSAANHLKQSRDPRVARALARLLE